MLGENSAPAIFSVTTNTNYSSSDYNGFRPNPGAATSFQWNSPPFPVVADYGAAGRSGPAPGGPAGGARGAAAPARTPTAAGAGRRSRSAASQRWPTTSRRRVRIEHSITVDYDVFVNVPKLDAKDLSKVQRLYKAEDLDFRLKPGAAAVDRGVVLPNITDGFTGPAPDLGALEIGQPAPIYGPRPSR